MAVIYCSGLDTSPALIDAARQLAGASTADAETLASIQRKVTRIAARRILTNFLKPPGNDA